jgi:riboflavin kinase/FMN adenylyltransferase
MLHYSKRWDGNSDYTVHVIPPVAVRGSRVSSTGIRDLIRSGRISQANRLLGRTYTFRAGWFRPGFGKNRSLSYAESRSSERDSPWKWCLRHDWPFSKARATQAVTNVGTRPTVAGTGGVSVETHLLEHTPESPPSTLELKFLHRLRNEHKFPSVDELKKQIAKDIQRSQAFFWIVQEVAAELSAVWLGQYRLRLRTLAVPKTTGKSWMHQAPSWEGKGPASPGMGFDPTHSV